MPNIRPAHPGGRAADAARRGNFHRIGQMVVNRGINSDFGFQLVQQIVGFGNLRPSRIVLIGRQGEHGQYPQDCRYDHQLDQRKPVRFVLHIYIFYG